MSTPADLPPQGPISEADLDPRLAELLAYWRVKRGSRRFPARADIDPIDLRGLLGNINLLDVVRGASALRFRYRLFGSEFVFYHGGDLTGVWVDEIPNPVYRAQLGGLYAHVVATGATPMVSYDYLLESRRHRFQALILPLAADGDAVDMILSSGLSVGVY
jgi:hypothetical protein